MFYVCIPRFQGTPLNSGSPLGGGTLLTAQPGETSSWAGDTDSLLGSGIVAGPASLQWISFANEAAATTWSNLPAVQSLLNVSMVSGYDGTDVGVGNVVMVIHRWRAWGHAAPSAVCPKCPPSINSGLPRWYGELVAGKTPAAPLETWVAMFASLTELNDWMLPCGGGAAFTNNSLYAIRVPTT